MRGRLPQIWPAAITISLLAFFVQVGLTEPTPRSPRQFDPVADRPPSGRGVELAWGEFSAQSFEQARRQNKLVLLSLEAGWCHWCHVMKETTYPDPSVVAQLGSYVLTRADSDARADLASRYSDYGWPATIILNEKGEELAALSGFQSPQDLAAILEQLSRTRKPLKGELAFAKPAAGTNGQFSAALRQQLSVNFFDHYDDQQGGFGFSHKFVNWNSCEYLVLLARQGQLRPRKMLDQTLQGALHLVDPEWGGIYQYSDSGVWTSPHYEKVMDHQAGNLRIFTLAYLQTGNPRYHWAAAQIARFLRERLQSPDGGYYTSQDADPSGVPHSKGKAAWFFRLKAAQREKNAPRIDKNLYARENGWAIEAQVQYALACQDIQAWQSALRAGQWMRQNLWNGQRFLHRASDEESHNLLDTLNGARACLSLYWGSGDESWLRYIEPSLEEIEQHHLAPVGLTSLSLRSSLPVGREVVLRDDNIALARFCHSYFLLSQSPRAAKLRDHALAYLAGSEATKQANPGGILLADWESRQEPIKLVVVGESEWFQQLLPLWGRIPTAHKQIRWVRPGTPSLLPACPYPEAPAPRAYLCRRATCRPVDSLGQLQKELAR